MAIVIWIVIVILIILSALFSGSETVLVSCDKHHFKEEYEKGNKRAKKIFNLISKPDKFLSAILVGNNISVISVSILFKQRFEDFTGLKGMQLVVITTLIVSIVLLILGEIIPKTVGLTRTNKLSYFSTRFINLVYILFFPVIILVMGISKAIERLFKIKKEDNSSVFSHKGELKSFVINTSLIEDLESQYISNILNYSKTTAREIMTPLVDVKSTRDDSSIEDLMKLITANSYSRYPVYKDRVDNLVGYVNILDLIQFETTDIYTIDSMLKEPYYIPETKKIGGILMDMQRKKTPMAFVIDEYGGCSGIITDEDIAEEIVGDILFESESESIIEIIKNEVIEADSQVDVDDINEKYNLEIEKDGFETLGGFVMYILGHIPKSGEYFEYKNFSYTVENADEKSIDKVVIRKKDTRKRNG